MFADRQGAPVAVEQINEQIASGNEWVRFLLHTMDRGFLSLTNDCFFMCSSVMINAGKPVRVEGGHIFTHIMHQGVEHEIKVDPACLDYVAW